MQQLHRGSERKPATMTDSERHEATTWDQRYSERQPAAIVDSEIRAATQWNWERQ